MMASAKGQYRLSYKLTDAADHTIEGGYIFTIIGDGFDGAISSSTLWKSSPTSRSTSPAKRSNCKSTPNRTDGTVLFFVRPTNGIYKEKPVVIRLKGKSSVQEIAVVKKDMPNFFVEAVTVAGGKVFTEVKEIVVPPEKRVLNVEVLPNETEYLPGQDAVVKVKLTELNGEPFVGSTVVSVYDKVRRVHLRRFERRRHQGVLLEMAAASQCARPEQPCPALRQPCSQGHEGDEQPWRFRSDGG
jgi:hypothetical protein